MPHMLAAEHMGYFSALRVGATRNQTTINAAIAAIGATNQWLVLDFTGDGVWTVTSNTTIAYLYVPLGVTVNVATGITLAVGVVMANSSAWKTGLGTINKSAVSTPVEISTIACTSYLQSSSQGGPIWEVNNGAASPAAVQAYMDQGGAATGFQVSRNIGVINSCWQINTVNSGDLHIVRPGGSPRVLINNTGMMLGANVAPSFLLQLATDSAAKPGTNTWTVASDERLKTVLGPYTDGMAFLLTLPAPQRFTYNGAAGLPVDGITYHGYIAQDMEAVAPHMVGAYEAKLDPEDVAPTAILTLNTSSLILAVVNALKEVYALHLALDTRVDTTETAITALDTRLDAFDVSVPALDTRVDTLETDVVTLDARVDTLEAA